MATEREAGLQALQEGNPAAAVPLLEAACRQEPADFDALLLLGAAYGQIGRQMDAINTMTRAVQLQPSNAQARYNLGIAMEQGGYRDQAILALEQAITLQPDYAKASDALQRLRPDSSAPAPMAAPEPGPAPTASAPTPAPTQASAPGGWAGATRAPEAEPPAFGSGAEAATAEGRGPLYAPPSAPSPPPGPGPEPPPSPNPYGPQGGLYGAPPPASPYASPPAANPWAPPPGSSPLPTPVQGPYPYSSSPAGMVGGIQPTFTREYAGFLARFGAAFIDGIIMTVVAFGIGIVAFIVLVAAAAGGAREGAGTGAAALFWGLLIIAGWLYHALLESSVYQGTLGKQAVGIVVTDLDGNRISFGRATARHFGKIVSTVILLIGFFMVAFTEKKQALHDIMAGCLVVNR